MSTFKNSHLMAHGCERLGVYHLVVSPAGALDCGHCGESVYGPDDVASDLVLSCDRLGARWHSVPFDVDVHRCGDSSSMSAAVDRVIDLTTPAFV